MSKPKEFDIEHLRSLIAYDPETGDLTWLSRGVKNSKRAGKRAGCLDAHGYCCVLVMGRSFKAHRIAFALHYGRWPASQIDHIDGDRANNRIANLREATNRENMQNQIRRPSNKSGYVGVDWHARDRKWRAQIRLNGKNHHLGLFDCPREAHAAYLAKKAELHTFNPVPRAPTNVDGPSA